MIKKSFTWVKYKEEQSYETRAILLSFENKCPELCIQFQLRFEVKMENKAQKYN